MEDVVRKDEFQTAVGNVLAEFDQIRDEFRRSQISQEAYLQRVTTLRQLGRRFHSEFRMAHRIMAAPLK
jgi:hypothetical protein